MRPSHTQVQAAESGFELASVVATEPQEPFSTKLVAGCVWLFKPN